MRRASLLLVAVVAAACVRHARAPDAKGNECACRGHARGKVDRMHLCSDWARSVPHKELGSHVAFPELDAKSCYVRVRYAGTKVKSDPIPPGCGYPEDATAAALDREALRFDAIAEGDASDLPHEIGCSLPLEERKRAARINAATLRATSQRIAGDKWPYAAVATFGYGAVEQMESGLATYRPEDTCPKLTPLQMMRLQPNVTRAGRAAEAYHAHVAPVVTVSGGAVHAPIYEAYILYYLLTCRFAVPKDAILVDVCADHTHTNVRNTASFVVALGGRSAYVVTDLLQSGYLQEWTSFDLVGGSIDQRSIRDFGYIVGSFRQASVGERIGFWLTPYRFFAEPRDELGSFTCVR